MPDPVKKVTLGGLTYNANQVKSAKEVQTGMYEIIFNTGEKITYPEQEPMVVSQTFGWGEKGYAVTGEVIEEDPIGGDFIKAGETFPRNAEVTQNVVDGLIYDDTKFEIKNVMGATFSSSKNTVTDVNLVNSSDCKIDLAANHSKWYKDTARVSGGADNEVILDDKDSADIAGNHIEGRGTAAQKDYYEER